MIVNDDTCLALVDATTLNLNVINREYDSGKGINNKNL
jgi:hypothetical protein